MGMFFVGLDFKVADLSPKNKKNRQLSATDGAKLDLNIILVSSRVWRLDSWPSLYNPDLSSFFMEVAPAGKAVQVRCSVHFGSISSQDFTSKAI